MKSIKELLHYSSTRLRTGGLSDPVRESASLMAFAIGRDHAFLRGHSEYILTANEAALFAEAVDRRAVREPFQYITGRQEFYGLEFEVNKHVLIPRPETELTVETGIGLLENIDEPQICDLGTGSGCISVALLCLLPGATATALDISPQALEVARRNAKHHEVADRVHFAVSDLFEAVSGTRRYDLIVSNPPYVPKADMDGLQAEVKNFEPAIALSDGFDGLTIYRRLIQDAPNYLKRGGWLVFEIGIYQSQHIVDMFSGGPWDSISTKIDLQGIPRVAAARFF